MSGLKDLIHILWPHVRELIYSKISAKIGNLNPESVEDFVDEVCFEVEVTVRRLVREINALAERGDIEGLEDLVRSHPDLAEKAAKYVARRVRWKVRRIVEEGLKRSRGGDLSAIFSNLRADLCDLLGFYRKKISNPNLQKLWEHWEDQFHELLDEMEAAFKEGLMDEGR